VILSVSYGRHFFQKTVQRLWKTGDPVPAGTDPGLAGTDPGLAGTDPGLAGTDPGLACTWVGSNNGFA